MSRRSENRFSLYLDADLKEKLQNLPAGRHQNDFVNQAVREKFEGGASDEKRVQKLEMSLKELEFKVRLIELQLEKHRNR